LEEKWTKEMDDALREAALKFGIGAWEQVMEHMNGEHEVGSLECRQRWQMIRELPVKGPW
jgi:Myb-like DNA-binding domain